MVSNFIAVAAMFTCLPALLLPQNLRWSEATLLRELPGDRSGYAASSPNGSAIVLWAEGIDDGSSSVRSFLRILTPGSGWSPATLVSGFSGSPEDLTAVLLDNGTAIASWRQVSFDPDTESSLMVGRLVPG